MTALDPDSARHSATPTRTSDPLIRPSVARARLAAFGIDATNIATLFAWMDAHGLRWHGNGPGKFHVGIDRWKQDRSGLEVIATADGLTFGNALVVALLVAVEAHPDLLETPRRES